MEIIDKLKKEIEEYKKDASLRDHIFDIKDILLSSESNEMMEFHYELSKDESIQIGLRNMIFSFFTSEITNKRDKSKTFDFFLKKYREEKDSSQKAEILKSLGKLKNPMTKDLVMENINSSNYTLRYASIIVLGWIGTSKDIKILNERMVNDVDGKLRGFSATAMRQIWYNFPKTKDTIANDIYQAALNEKNNDAIICMIITIQDLYKKKFGIKESRYGDVSGDVISAKEKMMTFLNKMIKK